MPVAGKRAGSTAKPQAPSTVEARPMGRPTDYTDELADLICERLADGKSLRSICRADDMPDKSTVFRWLAARPSFRDRYERAREAQADSHADDITDIADDPKLEPNDKRVRIDARKWLAAKLRPMKYGDASTVRHTGAIGSFDPTKCTDEQLAQLEAVLGPIAAASGDAGAGEGGEGPAGG